MLSTLAESNQLISMRTTSCHRGYQYDCNGLPPGLHTCIDLDVDHDMLVAMLNQLVVSMRTTSCHRGYQYDCNGLPPGLHTCIDLDVDHDMLVAMLNQLVVSMRTTSCHRGYQYDCNGLPPGLHTCIDLDVDQSLCVCDPAHMHLKACDFTGPSGPTHAPHITTLAASLCNLFFYSFHLLHQTIYTQKLPWLCLRNRLFKQRED